MIHYCFISLTHSLFIPTHPQIYVWNIAYANFLTSQSKQEIYDILVNGLRRLEYHGYDSAGLCVQHNDNYAVFKAVGKVQALADLINKQTEGKLTKNNKNNKDHLNSSSGIDLGATLENHVGVAHTRWATHGEPAETNSHPIRSDPLNSFLVVHNGIISNHKDLRTFLQKKGYTFETDTDTECAAKLAKYFYDDSIKKNIPLDFVSIVKKVTKRCCGAYAFIFISPLIPNQLVAVRKSSPLLIGVKTDSKMVLDFFDLSFGTELDDVPTSPLLSSDNLANITVNTSVGNLSSITLNGNIDMHANTQNNHALNMQTQSSAQNNALNMQSHNKNLSNIDSDTESSINTDMGNVAEISDIKNINKTMNATFSLRAQTPDLSEMQIFVASDASAIIEHTRKVIYLEDDDIAFIRNGNLVIHRPNSKEKDNGPSEIRKVNTLDTEIAQIMKGSYSHYMLKEIHEQAESVVNTMRGRVNFENSTVTLGGLQTYQASIKRSQRLILVVCGTSHHSSLATRALFEELIDIPVAIELASDFMDRKCLIFRSDCVLFVSQSGETADRILALRYCLERGALCVGITSTVGSTLSRETQCGVHINAGPEIGVASTKAYSSQFIALVLITLQLSQHNLTHVKRREDIIAGLKDISTHIFTTLKLEEKLKQYVRKRLAKDASLLILGRGYQQATCLEGALKIKEVAYLHAEGIMTGELKHGPLAPIDENINVILIVTNDGLLSKTQNAVQQIIARKENPMVLCNKDIASEFGELETIGIPGTLDCLQGLLTVIPLQLIAYHLAFARLYVVDCPTNLAKSVTVE